VADLNHVVWISHKDGERCAGCAAELARGDFVQVHREQGVRCLNCVGLGGLEFLPSGDAALTRRAAAGSARHAVVVKFSRARKRNERQGVLVEESALAKAREECAKDAAKRERVREKRRGRDLIADEEYRREFERCILKLFPSCPAQEAKTIAEHACRKHSGRVGRSAAAKEFASKAIELAVRAHVRHVHTEYDDLMARELDRFEARAEVRDGVVRMLEKWRAPVTSADTARK